MHNRDWPAISTLRAILRVLAEDVRGNTLIIMAAALIPLAGMVGGGVDLSRMYIVKTRLQHACDAGALAGRKAMGGGTWSQSNYAPRTEAEQFFDANITQNPYGASNLTKNFTENAGKVSGTASATLPMTLMRIFGKTTETLTVSCDAEMRLPNTDIMFVLDTTGSMGDTPAGDTQSKIASLKDAVKCFYEIVAKQDTDANCTTGTPSGGVGNQVQIRFGFVPYSTNVNVGYLLPTSYMADKWKYQSREALWKTSTVWSNPVDTDGGTTHTPNGWGPWQYNSWNWPNSSGTCTAPADWSKDNSSTSDSSATISGSTKTWSTTTTVSTTYYTYKATLQSSWYGNYCYIEVKSRTIEDTSTVNHTSTATQQQVFDKWHYGQIEQNISGLKNGTNWNTSFQLPIGSNGTMKTINWDGCIEERQTVRQSSYDPIPSGANDLNIDMVPNPSDPSTLWAPALPDVIYTRQQTSGWSTNWNLNDVYTSTDYINGSSYFCPTAAKKLQAWTPSNFDTYVDSLTPSGNTYHDIGLLWGARLMSPTGIFASENATTPQGGDIERHMIFMTDGDPCTNAGDYTAYGVHWFDRRETDPSVAPTGGCTTTGTITAQVNARTEALCTAIKNKNITLWVVSFGALASSTETRLKNCASNAKYFTANNAAQLQATFASIADQISQLRLTR